MNANPSTKQGLSGSGPAEDRPGVFLPVAAFVLMTLCWTTSDSAERLSDDKKYFNIPQQRADLSLTQFAEQAGLTLLFKFNIARRKIANNLTGHYTVNEAVEVLLADTGLHPVFSDQGQLMSVSDDMPETEGGSMKTINKTGLVAIIAGTLAGGVEAQELTATQTEVQTSIVTGKVTDARTGANLKGAKVTIEETGQWTSTNDLGEFRFVNVPTGSATLTVSYLGYAGQASIVDVRGDGASQNFALRGGSEMEEIVVWGQKSARTMALNVERTAENSKTVISSDLLGNFTGTTISDALRRAPGVAFEQDGATGEGTNIIIRGLAPDLNLVELNGAALPEVTGQGRSADLSGVLADSISSITISTTLLPNQESTGVGGLVEIETRSPLDRPKRYIDFGLEQTLRDDDFGEDLLASGTISGTFGRNDNFGLSASLVYRDQDIANTSYSTALSLMRFGQYLPLDEDGNPTITSIFAIDPRRPFPFEPGADAGYINQASISFGRTESETTTATLAAAWQPFDHTDLRLDYVHSERESTSFTRSSRFGSQAAATLLPVPSLGGEERQVNALRFFEFAGLTYLFPAGIDVTYRPDAESTTESISFRGTTQIEEWTASYNLAYSKGSLDSPRQFDGIFGNFIDTRGLPNGIVDYLSSIVITRDMFLPEAVDEDTGQIMSLFGRRTGDGFPLPLLNEEGLGRLTSPFLEFQELRNIQDFGQNDRVSIEASLRRDFDSGVLNYVEVGFDYEESEFSSNQGEAIVSYQGVGQLISNEDGLLNSSGPSIADLGIEFIQEPYARFSDAAGSLRTISERGTISFLDDLDSLVVAEFPDRVAWDTARRNGELSPNTIVSYLTANNTLEIDASTIEEDFAAYVQTSLSFGDLDIIGGLRLSSVKVEANFADGPTFIRINEEGRPERAVDFEEAFRMIRTETSRQTELLPRVLANYRFSDNLILRGGYFASVARPSVNNLSRTQIISLDARPRFATPSGGLGPGLRISTGNPALEPTYAHNFDLGVEYYFDNVGVVKARAFYKRIDNLLESVRLVDQGAEVLNDISLPDDAEFQGVIADAGDEISIEITRPLNNPDAAKSWGLELSGERQFDELPGAFSGLGLYANYTYTDSERQQFLPTTIVPEGFVTLAGPFSGQPEHSGTAGVTYRNYGIDASLLYSYQDRRLQGPDGNGLGTRIEAVDSLDLRLEYVFDRWGGTHRLYVEGRDLLRDPTEADSETSIGGEGGTPKFYTGGFYRGGRFVTLGFKFAF